MAIEIASVADGSCRLVDNDVVVVALLVAVKMATMAAGHCTGLDGEVVVSWDGFWWLSMAVEGLGMDIDGCE